MLQDPTIDQHHRLTATVAPDRVNAAMAELVGHQMSALTVSPASLEDLFRRHYETPEPDSNGNSPHGTGTDPANAGAR